SPKFHITVVIDSFYTDNLGQTPYYVTSEGVHVLHDFGWGFRKGAPFRQRFNQLSLQLKESGISHKWIYEVIARRVKENRGGTTLDDEKFQTDSYNAKNTEVLRLYHLQGAFYFMFLGYVIAAAVLLGEQIHILLAAL
ncbi:hypothetical protein OTU49_014715, partial [Cherax quadricarinatus]